MGIDDQINVQSNFLNSIRYKTYKSCKGTVAKVPDVFQKGQPFLIFGAVIGAYKS